MYRSSAISLLQRQNLSHRGRTPLAKNLNLGGSCDVFISHRSIDTKRTVASLLYDHLNWFNLRPFLDSKNMKPGDKLFEKIDSAIMGCKVGVAVFSPNFCDSFFCLHELALLMERKKKVIPIFCDVKPSELRVVNKGNVKPMDILRFSSALEEAKYTVGLTFDSLNGNWSDVVTSAADIVIDCLIEVEEEKKMQLQNTRISSLHQR